MGRGKSGGFRAVYYVKTTETVILLTVYVKTEIDNINTSEILRIIEAYLQELAEESETETQATSSEDTTNNDSTEL